MGYSKSLSKDPILLSKTIDEADIEVDPKKRDKVIKLGASQGPLLPLKVKAKAKVKGKTSPQLIVGGFR